MEQRFAEPARLLQAPGPVIAFPNTRPIAPAGRASFEAIARATLANYASATSNGHVVRVEWWINHFAGRVFAGITPHDVGDAVDLLVHRPRTKVQRRKEGNVLVEDGRTISGATVNRYISSLGTVFRDAQRMRLVRRGHVSPTRGVAREPSPPGRHVEITAEQVRHLIACARVGRNAALSAFVAVAATTGLRRGSLQALIWDRVDLRKGFIDVAKTKNGLPVRSVIRPFVVAELRALHVLQGNPQPGEFVFGPHSFKRSLRAALILAGLPEHWTTHHLRHVAASVLAASGATVPQIMATLCQKSPSMALRYSHLSIESQQQAAQRAWG